MGNVYEANAPSDFPTPKEQPTIEQQPLGEEKRILPVKETVERWKKEILDKIQFLKENYDQANRDKEELSQEIDRLKDELNATKERAQALERKLTETLETFNNLLDEVSGALQS
jgi:predicted RNase H-like nuclease (RuvC/YqgF family)